MGNQPKQYDDDDGRVIVDMDIEGMRWHDRRVRRENSTNFLRRFLPQGDQMTAAESRQYVLSAALAGLVVVLMFSVPIVLFILFCTEVWLK